MVGGVFLKNSRRWGSASGGISYLVGGENSPERRFSNQLFIVPETHLKRYLRLEHRLESYSIRRERTDLGGANSLREDWQRKSWGKAEEQSRRKTERAGKGWEVSEARKGGVVVWRKVAEGGEKITKRRALGREIHSC